MSKHSILSPSSSNRWLNCSGSVLLPQFIEDKDNTAANEGTLVHRINELKLTRDDWYNNEIELDECRKDALYNPIMEKYSDDYIEFINDQSYSKRLVEEVIDLSFLYDDFFGTADCILLSDAPSLHVIDFKYGKYPVRAEKNTQLMIYALGAVRLLQKEYPNSRDANFPIKLTIYQPRINNIDTYEMDYKELIEWNNKVLIPALAKVKFEQIEENSGDWCRFCKSRIFCKAYNDTLLEFENDPITALTNNEIEENYKRLEDLDKYVKHLKSYLTSEIKEGKTLKEYKLVAGRNNRYWNDTDKVKELLAKKQLDGMELMTPAKIEKLVGKETFKNEFEEYLYIKEGNPVLVSKNDKRKELIFEDKSR